MRTYYYIMKYLISKIALAAMFLLLFANCLFAQKITREQYINLYKDIAIHQMKLYGIPASIIMAQACLESGDGNSRLAVKGNNHFGIKCHNTWQGRRIYRNDDERGECFRRYSNPEDSFKDHSEFLKNGKRYQSLFDLKKTDYKAWAHGLKAAGYATNPKYASMLIEIIETNNLQRFDSGWAMAKAKYNEEKIAEKELKAQKKVERIQRRAERKAAKEAKKAAKKAAKMGTLVPVTPTPVPVAAVPTPVAPTTSPVAVTPVAAAVAVSTVNPQGVIAENTAALEPLKNSNLYRYSMDRQIYQENGVPYVIATQGDSYSSIAKEYNLFTKEVLSFNDLRADAIIEQGTIVYISRKKKTGADTIYTVSDGETMYLISQKKGIRLEALYQLNDMKKGMEPEGGRILNLRK